MKIISAAFFYIKKAAETTFVQKTRAINVEEIDTMSQPF